MTKRAAMWYNRKPGAASDAGAIFYHIIKNLSILIYKKNKKNQG